jgi:hypothetical protein
VHRSAPARAGLRRPAPPRRQPQVAAMTGASRRALLAGLLVPAVAGEGRAQGGQRPPQSPLAFSAAEQARINAWLVANAASLTPLPPGIARTIARGRALPPGIARRAAPQALLMHLRPRPGYEVLVVGTAVVLARQGTLVVEDLVQSALR